MTKYTSAWKLLVPVFCISLSACQEKNANNTGTAKVPQIELNKHIGWIHNHCLAIKNTDLKPDEKIILVSFETEQQLYNGLITNKTDSGAACPQLLGDRKSINMAEGYSFYLFKSDAKKLDLGIGLVGINPTLRKTNHSIIGDLNGDTIQDYFTQCSSSEGIHFNIWSAKPYKGEAIWTAYYYLGYDLEPNCPSMQ